MIKKIKSMLQIDKKLKRQALHSYFFECLLPLEKEKRTFICPLAKDLRDMLNYCVMEEGLKAEIIDEKIFEAINILKNFEYEAEKLK